MSARIAVMMAGAALSSSALPASAASPTSPVGRWLTQDGGAIVEIAPCGRMLCGTIARVLKLDPATARTDIHNPDPRLRSRPTSKLRILSDFVADGDRWKGVVYDPRSGRTYRSFLVVQSPGVLGLTGCWAFLCQTQTWQRAR